MTTLRVGSMLGESSDSAYSGAPWPAFDAEDAAAVAEVLMSGRVNYWTGQEGRSFEREFADFVGTDHAVWVANGTVALELALEGLDLPPGSEVITTPRSFFATVSSIVSRGLVPVFADVDADSGNISAESVESVVTPRTSAVVAVHLGGWPADMVGLRRVADEHGLALVEDCAQAHGAAIDGKSVGSFGDVAAWSFCQDKIMTTAGEGGMVTTSSDTLWKRMWSYKDHGKNWDSLYGAVHPPGFRWLHDSFGTNWRATEIQAVIGRRQLHKIEAWSQRRRMNAEHLARRLAETPALRIPEVPHDLRHAYYRLTVYTTDGSFAHGWDRQRFIEAVTSLGVPCFTGSCGEIYREKALADQPGFIPPNLPAARQLAATSLAFLVHPGLSQMDMDVVADTVHEVGREAFR